MTLSGEIDAFNVDHLHRNLRHCVSKRRPVIVDLSGIRFLAVQAIQALCDFDSQRRRISAGVADVTDRRAVIEQAKGMLALLYGLDEDAAFGILRWRSQESNLKLRAVAEQLVAEFRALGNPGRGELPSRRVYDHALLTLHERM